MKTTKNRERYDYEQKTFEIETAKSQKPKRKLSNLHLLVFVTFCSFFIYPAILFSRSSEDSSIIIKGSILENLPLGSLEMINSIVKERSDFPIDYTVHSPRDAGRFYLNELSKEPYYIGKKVDFTSDETCMNGKDARLSFLCRLNVNKYCRTRYVAEMIDKFWIIAPIYSYDQPKQLSYYRLHDNFKGYIESIGLPFCTIEAIQVGSDQKYIATKPGNEPHDIQLTYRDEIYLRENLLNIAMRKIPEELWDYFAWIDGHQVFENPYWWEEAIVKMNKYATLQLFTGAYRLNPTNTSGEHAYGAVYTSNSYLKIYKGEKRREIGNAYSISKDEYWKIGSVLDTCIASFCDCLFLESILTDKADYPIRTYKPEYLMQYTDYINRTQSIVKGRSGYVRGEIYHFHHLRADFYWVLLDEIAKTNFDMNKDLARDENGTLYIKNDEIRDLVKKTIRNHLVNPRYVQ